MSTTWGPFARKSVWWAIGLSIFMIAAGVLAVASHLAAGIRDNILIAWLLILSGCAHVAFGWFARKAGEFRWELILGILYSFIGAFLLYLPFASLTVLAILLAVYLFWESILDFIMGFELRPQPSSRWFLFDAIVTLVLAVTIWKTWTTDTSWMIGALVGVGMLFSGITRLIVSLAARSGAITAV